MGTLRPHTSRLLRLARRIRFRMSSTSLPPGTLTFADNQFEGGIDGQDGEPLLAKQIATEGKEWVNTHWRKEDMTAYVFRLYLEWARLLAPSKHGADFVYDESMERSRFE